MTRSRIVFPAVVWAFVLLSATAWAEQAASVAGVVRDTTGAVLPGVTVEAASPALIEKTRTTVSDSEGQYRIVELRPGVYAATNREIAPSNVLNGSAVDTLNTTDGPRWLQPIGNPNASGAIQEGRLVTVGGQLNV